LVKESLVLKAKLKEIPKYFIKIKTLKVADLTRILILHYKKYVF